MIVNRNNHFIYTTLNDNSMYSSGSLNKKKYLSVVTPRRSVNLKHPIHQITEQHRFAPQKPENLIGSETCAER